jgi:hypothetical protein
MPPQHVPAAAYTVNEFCAAHRICRATLYKLWDANKGPRFMRLGPQKILITAEAAAEWRAAREAETATAVAA